MTSKILKQGTSMIRFFQKLFNGDNSSAKPEPKEIEMMLMLPETNDPTHMAQLCISNTGEWYHLVCKNDEVAKMWASSLLREDLVRDKPKVQLASTQFQPQYAPGSCFLRIHKLAIEKIKLHYAIKQPIERFASANKIELSSADSVVPPPSLD